MNTVYMVCFVLGLVLSLLAAFSGLGRVHIGHLHWGHGFGHSLGHGVGHGVGHAHTQTPTHARPSSQISALNGFTLPAFLCWFGGAGYLLRNYSPLVTPVVLLLAIVSGLVGAGLLYAVLFKFLIPHERVLSAEDTRMEGVLGHVSSEIRSAGGTGEILFSQIGARRSAAARSESGGAIPHGTEVVVLRYSHGIAYVCPLDDVADELDPSAPDPSTPLDSSSLNTHPNQPSQRKDAC